MTAFFSEVFETTEFLPASANISIPQAILAFCMKNYQKPVTLGMISHELYISPNYISRIFSLKLRISLTDYRTTWSTQTDAERTDLPICRL